MISKKLHLFQSKFPKNFNFLGNFTKNFDFLKRNPQNLDFSGNFTKNFYFSGNFTKSFDFLRTFAKNFYFFRQFKKNRFFQGKVPKNFDFLGNFTKNFDFPGINWLFAAISGKIILFLFKIHHFLTYLLYMVRYNNILRPVHDPRDPSTTTQRGARVIDSVRVYTTKRYRQPYTVAYIQYIMYIIYC